MDKISLEELLKNSSPKYDENEHKPIPLVDFNSYTQKVASKYIKRNCTVYNFLKSLSENEHKFDAILEVTDDE